MSRSMRQLVVSLGLCVSAFGAGAALVSSDAIADTKIKDPVDQMPSLAGQILFMDQAPSNAGSAAWFPAHKIGKRDENSDKKWILHTMVFLKKPLDTSKLDLRISKFAKGNTVTADYVQKIEQFPNGDGKTFYFTVTLKKNDPPAMEPNLVYLFEAVDTSKNVVASGKIELDGKEEKIAGSGNLDFTTGMDLNKKEEKPTQPFDSVDAKKNLDAVIYEDCKTAVSKGGDAMLLITFGANNGKVTQATFVQDPPAPYTDGTQKCIVGRFTTKAKTKAFTGADKTVKYKVTL